MITYESPKLFYKMCLVRSQPQLVMFTRVGRHYHNDQHRVNFDDGFGNLRMMDRAGKRFAFDTVEEAKADFLTKVQKKRNALLSKVNYYDDMITAIEARNWESI